MYRRPRDVPWGRFTTVIVVTEGVRYFAYGSNMSRAQMDERCPGACHPVAAVLADHTWICNERGVATVVPVPGRTVHGVMWDVSDAHIISLDRHEGVAAGRYRRATLAVALADSGADVDAVIYIDDSVEPGPPRPGYLERVVDGATEHGLPDAWLTYLKGWARAGRPATPDRTDGPGTLTELLATPGVEESVELRSRFGFMALHGGDLELMTDVIAAAAAEEAGASLYALRHPPDLDHHLPSTRYRPGESPGLAAFLDHVDLVISIHGYGRRGRWTDVMAGGRNRALAHRVAETSRPHLDGFTFVTDLDDIPAPLRGQHPDNPVNLPRGGGTQLELPPRVRGLSPLSPPPGPDGLSPPTRALIAALAEVASADHA